ncbi:hypothetical protein RSAG8_10205, partial [Rhizoctonia solani AG-8 WAC10335]
MLQLGIYALGIFLVNLRGANAKDPLSISLSEWDAFNTTVGGRLRRGVPFARDCLSRVGPGVGPTAPGTDCGTVQTKYADNGVFGPARTCPSLVVLHVPRREVALW